MSYPAHETNEPVEKFNETRSGVALNPGVAQLPLSGKIARGN